MLNPNLAGESSRALSGPVQIGTVLVGGKGTFAGSFVLPQQVTPGKYILQITGYRVKKAKPAQVKVFGQTWDLNGKKVTARVKLAGESKYSTGSSRTVDQGEFTWQRKTGKKVYVYFKSGDVRSNRVIIPGNRR